MALDFICSLSKPQHNVEKMDISHVMYMLRMEIHIICINVSTVCMEDINNRVVIASEKNKNPS